MQQRHCAPSARLKHSPASLGSLLYHARLLATRKYCGSRQAEMLHNPDRDPGRIGIDRRNACESDDLQGTDATIHRDRHIKCGCWVLVGAPLVLYWPLMLALAFIGCGIGNAPCD